MLFDGTPKQFLISRSRLEGGTQSMHIKISIISLVLQAGAEQVACGQNRVYKHVGKAHRAGAS
jgi:hypothetical protein